VIVHCERCQLPLSKARGWEWESRQLPGFGWRGTRGSFVSDFSCLSVSGKNHAEAPIRDQQIERALMLLHSHPQESWTVASHARRLAVSRSAFAARSTELVCEGGAIPLSHWPSSTRPAARLRSTNETLSEIAAEARVRISRCIRKVLQATHGHDSGGLQAFPAAGTPRHRQSQGRASSYIVW